MDVFALIAEEKIRAAQSRGDFDNLPGSGKPLSPDDGANVPEELRMAYKVLKNSGYLPPEVAERKEIESLFDIVEGDSPEHERLRAMRRLEALLFALGRKGRSIAFGEHDAYYAAVLSRFERIRNR